MPSRRRRAIPKKPAVPVESVPPPVVTQVVEVVEEEIPVAASNEMQSVQAEPVSKEEVTNPESESTKSRVEELYQKKPESSVMPEISVEKKKPATSILVWAVVTILVALVTGGILFTIAKKGSSGTIFFHPKPTPTPTVVPTATPMPAQVDKTSFKIQVLNGGGTPGAASKMKTFLEDKGYTVSGTGNTDEYTYTETEIHGKSAMKDATTALQADLTGTYTVGTVAADLSSSASADVQVIVGK